MTKARDLSKLLSTANGKIAGANLDVSFENISDTGTAGTKVASGTTNQRGSTAGQIRFNTTTGLAEYYTGTEFKVIDAPPTVTAISPLEVDSTAGGNITFTITGSNFGSGAVVKFIGSDATEITASTTTVNSGSSISAIIARSSFVNAKEPYDVKVTNVSGLSGTLDNQINVDASPTWNTASGNIADILDDATGTHATVSATDVDGDTVSYSETGGTVLTTAGLTLNSSTGAISGDPTNVASNTTYSFTLRATANSKTVDRAFNIIVGIKDGSTSAKASISANTIKTLTGTTTSGLYWINCGGTPKQIYCDMTGLSGNAYMLMATMKDMQSTWTGGGASTANTNIQAYTNWHYDSNWWTSATGSADIVANDYNFTLNRDYKSHLWNVYSIDNSSLNGIYLVNGNNLATQSKRIRVGGTFSPASSTLTNVFNGTTTINGDNDNANAVGSAFHYSSSTIFSNATPNNNINKLNTNWVNMYSRIGGHTSGDATLYGSTLGSGAGFKYFHGSGSDTGSYPVSNYGLSGSYTQGISMTLWVK